MMETTFFGRPPVPELIPRRHTSKEDESSDCFSSRFVNQEEKGVVAFALTVNNNNGIVRFVL